MTSYGEYITKRLLPTFIADACNGLGIQHATFFDEWVQRMQRKSVRRWVIGYSFDLNTTAASSVARDKVATYKALEADSVPAVEHFLARSRSMKDVREENLISLKSDQPVVIKPLEGTSGHGVHKFVNVDAAISYLEQQPHTDWAISPFYDVVAEMRLILLDSELLCAYEKSQPADNNGLPMYNLGLGAKAVVITPNEEVLELAKQAMKSISLRLCTVDITKLSDGQFTVMEINEGIMMEHFARQSEEYYATAQDVYRKIVERMFE